MNKKLIGLILGATTLLSVNVGSAAEKIEGVMPIKVKNFKVLAINDALNTFSKSIFTNIDNDKEKLALMPDGRKAF